MYEHLTDLEPYELEQFAEEGLTDRPQDYYFAIEQDVSNLIANFVVIITPKLLWDRDRVWSDSGSIWSILENHLGGYHDLMEATFEYPEGMTIAQVQADLTNRGFVENPGLLPQS